MLPLKIVLTYARNAITVCKLQGDEYQKQLFLRNEQLISPLFPSLQLTAAQVFASSSL